jgi:uncharacterized RDD family membrane protein YckC
MSDLAQLRSRKRYTPALRWETLPAALAGRELAGYGERLGAALVDALLAVTVVGLVVNVTLMGRYGPRNGMTVGKQLFGIRVIRHDRHQMTVGFAILRDVIVRALLLAGLLLDGAWPLWDERHQALHDKVVGSYVVRASRA